MHKITLSILLILFGLFVGFWTFNHINPWVGILIAVGTIYLAITKIINKLNK